MSLAQPPSVRSGNADAVEAAFYEALQTADIEKLMACWADEESIVCVHPGGRRLIGAASIRASFDAIFSHGSLSAHGESVRRVQSPGVSIHSVLERLDVMTAEGPGQAYVLATTVYLNTAQGWRMVAHHASPGTLLDLRELANDGPQVLH